MALQLARARAGGAPTDLLVEYLAATFLLLLNWWVETGRLSPGQLDDVFVSLVLPTLITEARGR